MTDQEQAEAVVNGLANSGDFTCRCGRQWTNDRGSRYDACSYTAFGEYIFYVSCVCGACWERPDAQSHNYEYSMNAPWSQVK